MASMTDCTFDGLDRSESPALDAARVEHARFIKVAPLSYSVSADRG